MPSKPKPQKPAEPSAPPPQENPAGAAQQAAAQSAPPELDEEHDQSQEEEMEMRVNPRIEKEIADYKAAYPKAVEYFTKLVKENPARAINFHFREKQKQHAMDTKRAMRQMPQAQALYERMSPASKELVDQRMENVPKYSEAKRFVWAVRREMNRTAASETSRLMNAPVTKIAPEAPAPEAPKPDAPAPAAPKAQVG
jgi:hypothetical protein